MSTKAGALLWNRMRITVPSGNSHPFDTGLTQVNRDFADQSPNEPPFGVTSTTVPANGTPPASRIQVIPLSPVPNWALITHSEPYLNPTTNTIWVAFSNANESAITINALFWDPHTLIGPGKAATYH